MPENPEVKVTLTAEDQGLSAALRQLSEELKNVDRQQGQLASGSRAAATAVRSNFTSIKTAAAEMASAVKLRLANIPGLGGFGSMLAVRAYEPIGKLGEQVGGDLEEKFGGAALAVGGLAAGLVALGAVAVDVTRHMWDLSQSIENTAAATGNTTDQVQAYTELAKEMGVDAGTLNMAFATINRQIGEFTSTGKAAGEGSEMFIRVMEQLGISLQKADGSGRQAQEVLEDFYDALQRIPDPAARTQLALEALGSRGQIFVEMFGEATREGVSFRDLLNEISETGPELTEGQLANNLRDKLSWDERIRSAKAFLLQLKEIITFSASHPLKAVGALASQGVGAGPLLLAESMIPPADAKPGSGAGPNAEQLEIAARTETLQKLLDTRRAGGELQLELDQDRVRYAADIKRGDVADAKALALQISLLRQLIALDAERHKRKEKKPFAPHGEGIEFHKPFTMGKGRAEEAPEIPMPAEPNVMLPGIGSLNDFLGQRAAAQSAIEQQQQMLQRGIEQFRIDQENIGAGPGGESEKERQYLHLLQQEMPLLEQKAQAELAAARAANDPERIISAEQTIQQLRQMKQLVQQLGTAWKTTLNQSMRTALSRFVDSATSGARSIAQAFGQLEVSVLRSLETMAEQMLVNALTQKQAEDGTKASDAASAARGAFNALVHIPIIGPELAAVAAAAAFAMVMSFEQGGIVPGAKGQAVPIMAHAREMILPEHISTGLDAAIRGGALAPNIASPSDFRAPTFQMPSSISAAARSVDSHDTFILQHTGPDARQVLEEELVPRLLAARRNGMLDGAD